ncbi:MAG TPA: hypothetical protein VJS43_12530 [Candidatus Acidoferrales bacterium]|nr:hypothetical protein [Candidatus Acidoferrales bacterium]
MFLLSLATTSAQDPTVTLPNNYKLVFDNSAVAVIHVHYEPHEKIPLHDHSKFPTVYVYLSDSGPVLFSHVEAHPFSYTRRPVKLGAYRVSPGRIEKHYVENKGDIPTDFLRVELKQLPIRHFTDEFRGQPPPSLSSDMDVTEFSNSDVAVERIVCVPDSSCAITPAPSPSLVIAFTAAQTADNRAGPRVTHMKIGGVQWMDGGDALSLHADSSEAAHVLRILLRSNVVPTSATSPAP